jgi:hypothetical protein
MKKQKLILFELFDRNCPAILDIMAGALSFIESDPNENNSLTVAVSGGVYSFKDTASLINLGAGAINAGWRGNNSNTVSGPEASVNSINIDAGSGINVINIKSSHDPLTINGDDGNTTINLNSVAPVLIGNLATLTAPIQVDAGVNTKLNIGNYAAPIPSDPIIIDTTGIYFPSQQSITYTGQFESIHVKIPRGTPLSKVLIDNPLTSNLTVD